MSSNVAQCRSRITCLLDCRPRKKKMKRLAGEDLESVPGIECLHLRVSRMDLHGDGGLLPGDSDDAHPPGGTRRGPAPETIRLPRVLPARGGQWIARNLLYALFRHVQEPDRCGGERVVTRHPTFAGSDGHKGPTHVSPQVLSGALPGGIIHSPVTAVETAGLVPARQGFSRQFAWCGVADRTSPRFAARDLWAVRHPGTGGTDRNWTARLPAWCETETGSGTVHIVRPPRSHSMQGEFSLSRIRSACGARPARQGQARVTSRWRVRVPG